MVQWLNVSEVQWFSGSVAPAHVFSPSINNPGLRRSSSASPHEARLLDLGVMVDTSRISHPDHVPDPGAPGAISYTDNSRASSEAFDPTESPAPLTSLVAPPLADITNIFAVSR